jgi:hypothetical protein
MRRMRIITPLCLLLLVVPLYLWKVQGWWSPEEEVKPTAPLPTNGKIETDLERLARSDPVELLYQSLRHYQEAGIKGYTCTLVKQERINGKLNPTETIDAWFQEEPYRVFMHWLSGVGKAEASLYVVNENDNKMCVRPSGPAKILGWVKCAPNSGEAKDSTRYFITEFGMRCGTERTYKAWKSLQDRGIKLNTEYVGLSENVPEAGGRDCHVLKRYCDPPEEEGLTEITLFIDAETWQQVGTILKANNELIGSYFFKDIQINPVFDQGRFKPEMLKKY